MIIRIFLTTIFILSLAVTSSAEFYKYRDANGVLRFTDNLAEVPKDQREKAQSYEEIKSAPVAEEVATETEEAKDTQAVREKEYEDLQAEKEALDNEFEQIESERKELVEKTRSPKNDEEYAAYQEEIKNFNARVQAYEDRLAVFEKKVATFNTQAE